MKFRLLGNLEVVIDGAPVDIGGTQPRTVLAMLLVAGGRVVPAETIIEALWGEEPPDSAAGTLQSYVSRLRRALVPGGARGEAAKVLAWDPPGYKLVVGSTALDTRRFESLADQGRGLLLAGDPEAARTLLDEALGLWRGPALLEFSHLDFAWGFAATLEERRLAATEDRIDADLRLGRHTQVVGELGELIVAHPLREQLRHLMALALYRAGRQAEALRILDDTRRTLRSQLGIDPGRPLVELEAAILSQDPALDLPPPAGRGGVAAAAPPPVGGDRTPSPGAGPPPAAPGAAAPATAASAPATATSAATAATASSPAPSPAAAGSANGAAAAPATAGGPALVGREAELRQAVSALDETQGATRVVLVEGEPGIGKTRLMEELAAEAAGRGTTVLWGRAFEGGATPAFWPWLPPLRALAAARGDAELAPELAAVLGSNGNGSPPPAPAADHTRFQLFDAVAELMRAAAARQRLVLVLDDLQWADLPSLELLTFVAGQLVDAPILLACTVRQLEVGRNDAVVEALAALSRAPATRRIFLRGLSAGATAELVAAASGRTVDDEVTAAIRDRAEGNPFFATELARLVAGARTRADALGTVAPGGDVPSGVRDVVRRRIALLPEPTVRLLQVAAVIGRDVALDLLTAAAGADVDAVLDGIEPAIVHRLLAPVPDKPATFRFSHALVREVLADDVSALRRARIHLAVADALEATVGELDDAAEILAEHLWAAAPIGVGARAAPALERAAEVTVRRFAFEVAEDFLVRAVQMRRTSSATADDYAAELKATSRLLSVQRSVHGYNSVADSPHLRRAKELATRLDRVEDLARLLWTEWAAYDTSGDFARSDPIADQLRELGRDHADPLVRVTGLAALGTSKWHQGDVTEAVTLLDEAIEVSASATAPALTLGLDLEVMVLPIPLGLFMRVLAGALGTPDDPREAEAVFQGLAAAAPDRYAISLVQVFAAGGALMSGHYAWAERAARRGIEADPESLFSFWGRGLHAYLATALIELGNLEEGLPMVEWATRRFNDAGGRTGTVVFKTARAAGLAEAGRLDEAAEAVTEMRRELETYREMFAEPVVIEAEARVRHARGVDPAEVRTLLASAVDLAARQGSHAIAHRVAGTAARLGHRLPPPAPAG
ncbi:MAG TPA: BTAD domain-containing putative transcriptional regulator [Acidimicrobiales bacterium]|nr:BTAD domain-containing putative transcriptional regulator [Acidimicrobiales bacterium]